MESDVLVIILVIIIVLTSIFREIVHIGERRDFLDRLMAKNLPEYKDNVTPVENQLEPEDDGTVDIADAKDALYGEEEN